MEQFSSLLAQQKKKQIPCGNDRQKNKGKYSGQAISLVLPDKFSPRSLVVGVAGAADLDVAAYNVGDGWVSRKSMRRFMLANQWSQKLM